MSVSRRIFNLILCFILYSQSFFEQMKRNSTSKYSPNFEFLHYHRNNIYYNGIKYQWTDLHLLLHVHFTNDIYLNWSDNESFVLLKIIPIQKQNYNQIPVGENDL